jgi:hypothetical protein
MIGATIVAIAKLEHWYIEEWVKYPLYPNKTWVFYQIYKWSNSQWTIQ